MPEQVDEQLRRFVLAKQEVASALHSVKQWLETRGTEESKHTAQNLLVKLAEDRFNLAVVGQFKRGKSSLMNAVIGRDLLPTGLLPLTSAITTLCYGPRERIFLIRRGWVLEHEISLHELPEYVTECGNPGNEKGLIEARVELPVAFLRRGLHFVDTPGIGSARQENTATTYAFLPEADAIIFVTSVEAPLSEAEQRFLQDIRPHAHKLFIVVNKIDLLTHEERDQVLDYVRAGIAPVLGTSTGQVYPLSARQGLEAKLRRDVRGVRQSGMEDLEAALASFLAGEKSRVFLTAILSRALRLLPDPEAGARSSPQQDSEIAADETLELRRLQDSLEVLRAVVQSPEEGWASRTETDADSTVVQAPLERAIEASQLKPKAGLGAALAVTRTCPICAAQSQAVFDFFAHWQYAVSSEQDARRAFSAARGFCRVHTWQFERLASPQGMSEGYAPLIESAMAQLRPLIGRAPEEGAAAVDALLPTSESCPACRLLRQIGSAQMARFMALIATSEGQESYRRSQGLCLPHLKAALLSSPSQEVADFLLGEQANRLTEISEDMHNYLLKRDALRRGLLNDNEEDAWRRALLQLAGASTAQELT